MIYICLLEEALCQPPGHRLSWLPVTGSVQEGARWHLNVDEGLGLSDVLRSSKLESESRSVVSDSLRPHGLYSPWNSLGQNTGVGSLSVFQGIFPTQGWNPGLQHCRQILYRLSRKGSPNLECCCSVKYFSGEDISMQIRGLCSSLLQIRGLCPSPPLLP